MSATFEINSASSRYSVTIGQSLLHEVTERYPDSLYIVDSNLLGYLPDHITKRVIIEAIEDNKSLEMSADFISAIRKLGANRDTHIVAIGGGIIQDIVTFLASIYMRGLRWTYMPTTVLAMVDSCIGGKSSINVMGYKNLVGIFYPPDAIFIDLDFIKTLDPEMIVGGLFESAKICFAKSSECFANYLTLNPSANIQPVALEPIVQLSLLTKKWFIEIDEFDQKERLLLNFGHTFGHAIESATDFFVSHGISVGVGMLCACEFSEQNGLLSPLGQTATLQLKDHARSMIGEGEKRVCAVPPSIDLVLLMEKFEYDKKHRTDHYRLVLPKRDGALELVSIPKTAATRASIQAAFQSAFDALRWDYIPGQRRIAV